MTNFKFSLLKPVVLEAETHKTTLDEAIFDGIDAPTYLNTN